MSVQFGRWSLSRDSDEPLPVDVHSLLAPFGPDGTFRHSKGEIEILYCPFRTTQEAADETQPLVLASGAVFVWDGRLDNRAECAALAGEGFSEASPDNALAAGCYARLGTSCFARLLGDWALSIWNPLERSLLLARDAMGIRPLYYSADAKRILWSTILDPLVFLVGVDLEPEYLAGWMGTFPAPDLTPFRRIRSVPPAGLTRFTHGRITQSRFWNFDPSKTIRYKSDGEYEEHFLHSFDESVRRRLRSSAPVLAELSGGMDSCSIVSVADRVLCRDNHETPRLDTLSYYDDLEPGWNEQPYFETVEQKRGRAGHHIDTRSQVFFQSEFRAKRFRPSPSENGVPTDAERRFREILLHNGYRVLLSGFGGDEVTGGVPSPHAELRDLAASFRIGSLAGMLRRWAVVQGRPWTFLLWEAVREFLPGALRCSGDWPEWLAPRFGRQYQYALLGYPRRIRFLSARPSFDEAMLTVEALRRQIAVLAPVRDTVCDVRYPFLDRELLEFLFAVPREQLLRPGERRSLQRRALRGIVPGKILERRRKAFKARSSLTALVAEQQGLHELTHDMLLDSLGIVREREFQIAMDAAGRGGQFSVFLLRALALEIWLRDSGVMASQTASLRYVASSKRARPFQVSSISCEEKSLRKGGKPR
jgi:asparagine synthase (glutamine-hydrolysing)